MTGKRRCDKGKPCGATCIERDKICRKDAREKVSAETSQVRDLLSSAVAKPKVLSEGEVKALKNVNETLSELENSPKKPREVDGVSPAKSVNWNAGREKGAEYVASGAFGSFVLVPADNLAPGLKDKFPEGVGVKYGKIGADEVSLLKKIGDLGAGPQIIAAKFSGDRGAIAMEVIPGKTAENALKSGEMSKAQANDAYLKALATIHRAGISHNDAHFGNVIIQPNGVAKLVDLGHAAVDSKKALGEALRRSYNLEGKVAQRIEENLKGIMQSLGRPDIQDAFGAIVELNSLLPKSPKVREEFISEFIGLLYEGV